MNVFIDTNILISAILNPSGTPAKAYFKAVTQPHHGIICSQNADELFRIFQKKFPTKITALEKFFSIALHSITLVDIPSSEDSSESQIRDIMDRPILRAAISAHADIILTGDKDFLESGITSPRCITASDFLTYY